jgi:PT repeat-containing protein
MSENSEQSNVANLVRRFWWVAVIIIILLIFLCGLTQAEQILKLFNPPEPTEAVTQPPTDAVTQPPATERATDEPTDKPTDEPTDQPTDKPGDGACNAPCSPTASNCLAGLSCVPSTANSDKFICWNADICLQGDTTPVVTEGSGGQGCECRGVDLVCAGQPTSYNSAQCGGEGKCACRGDDKVWACPDGTYASFNPNCGVGGDDNTCTCIYVMYPYYSYRCQENPNKTCSP